eukprot:UN31038
MIHQALDSGGFAHDNIGERAPLWKHIVSLLFWALCCVAAIYYNAIYIDTVNYDRIAYAKFRLQGIIWWVMTWTTIILNWTTDSCGYGWKQFQIHFEKFCGFDGTLLWGILFFVTGVIAYVFIGIEEGGIWNGEAADWCIYITYYLAFAFFILCFMATWELISYYCSTIGMTHGFLYLTIVGGLVLHNARWLRPPPTEEHVLTWHRVHDTDKLIAGILLICNYAWLFFVVLGCVGIAIFSEFSIWVADLGILIACLLFIIGAFAIMLNPIAPGSVIDACGGFYLLST